MSIAIAFRFLAGRFHATPWDRHPNEGIPEWPPAPWRILRAIVAAAYRADGDPDPAVLSRVVGALSGAPAYRLPAATGAHLRSYMPQYKSGDTSLVFDAFVVVGRGAGDDGAEVVAEWPSAALTDDDGQVLDRWLSALGYLGRAESWVEARRAEVGEGAPSVTPMEATDDAPFRARLLAPRDAHDPSAADALLEALTTDTGALYKSRLAEPPASRWQDFRFDAPPFSSPPLRPRRAPAAPPAPTIVRLVLGGRVLPMLIDAVRFGDRVRAALMGRSRGADGLPHPVFSGKSHDGSPLAGYGHAHILPLDEDRDGRIDHVLLWAPTAFDQRAMAAIAEFTWLWGDEGFDLRVGYAGAGRPGDSAASFGVARVDAHRSAIGTSTRWQSRTPFVLPRHPKVRRGLLLDGPEAQLRRECARAGLPPVVSISALGGTDGPNAVAWHRFRLQRAAGGGSRGSDRGFGFVITFARDVNGPIALGYGARQGLGQFEPVP